MTGQMEKNRAYTQEEAAVVADAWEQQQQQQIKEKEDKKKEEKEKKEKKEKDHIKRKQDEIDKVKEKVIINQIKKCMSRLFIFQIIRFN